MMLKILKGLAETGGVKIGTLKVLAAINEFGPMQVSGIAEVSGMSERSAWTHRTRAVELKLIKRVVDDDKTRATYDLTDKTKLLFNQ